MKHFIHCISRIVLCVLLAGCAAPPIKQVKPDWINNPGNGVVASAGINVYGRAAQEEQAIARAKVEMAKRMESINGVRLL